LSRSLEPADTISWYFGNLIYRSMGAVAAKVSRHYETTKFAVAEAMRVSE
jgi:hypothetical protein